MNLNKDKIFEQNNNTVPAKACEKKGGMIKTYKHFNSQAEDNGNYSKPDL